MTFDLRGSGVETILLDIEGTTTTIAFVHDVLFPYARRALAAYVRDHLDRPELGEVFTSLHEEWRRDVGAGQSPPTWDEQTREQRIASIVAYATWLMDRDRKAFGLKALQGHIWQRGYENGELRGEVFSDVPAAFSRWREAGLSIAIFSSGSVLAQRLLFGTTTSGDLTPWISAYFDTTVGAKNAPGSYESIAATLQRQPSHILFISDSAQELEAARAAGCQTLMSHRPGNTAQSPAGVPVVRDFDGIG